jgi:DNA-binding MarR family transcriptional regulator
MGRGSGDATAGQPGSRAEGPDEQLLIAIQRLGRLMGSRQVSGRLSEAAGADLGQQGVQLLRVLLRVGELPIAGLAAEARMDIAAVSRQLRVLEQGGLVRRATAVDDARVALVTLTPEGTSLAKRLREVGLRHLGESLSTWSRQDRDDLARLLGRLVDDLQATEIEQLD